MIALIVNSSVINFIYNMATKANIKVAIRIRPVLETEAAKGYTYNKERLRVLDATTVRITTDKQITQGAQSKQFTFD